MRTNFCFSRPLAIALGISCCFFDTPALAHSPEHLLNTLSDERSVDLLEEVSEKSCLSVEAAAIAENEFAEMLLFTAENALEQIVDMEQKGTVLYHLGKSYACLGQREKADGLLQQSFALVSEIRSTYYQGDRIVEIAAVYSDVMGDMAQMNAILAEVLALVTIDPDTGENFHYSILEDVGRAYAEYDQYQQLRALVDSADINPHVPEQIMSVAVRPLLQGKSSSERDAIEQLFPEFDLDALFSDSPVPFDRSTLATDSDIHPLFVYQEQLRASEIGVIDNFIADQGEIVEQFQDPLVRAVAHSMLGEFVSSSNYPAAALPILEASLQDFNRSINEQSLDILAEAFIFEHSHRARIEFAIASAHVRAGDFERGQALVREISTEQSLLGGTAPGAADHQLIFLQAVPSDYFSWSSSQRQAVLSESEMRLSRTEDDARRFYTLLQIADAYIDSGDIAAARRLIPIAANEYAVGGAMLSHNYAQFLIGVGEYEQAIALSTAAGQNSDLPVSLPAYFVEAREYAQAEDLFDALPTVDARVRATSRMVEEYYELGLSDRMFDLTARTLNEIQSDSFDREIAENYWFDCSDRYSEEAFTKIERDRIYTANRLLFFYVEANAINYISGADITESSLIDDAQRLITSIDNKVLRSEMIQETLPTERSLTMFVQDAELDTPNSAFLQWALESAAERDFDTATSAAGLVRSPYLRAILLSEVANSYMANSARSPVSDETMQSLQEMTQ